VLVDILGEECHDCFPSSLTTWIEGKFSQQETCRWATKP
jgi:hypothetical protein